ncbi:NAD(P)-dependent oxidoreductase [Methylomonas sp. SURF-1]|uniref:NAD(P)-dependent oxidoreductase n=1 Tax=Methylomonas aurea TaxID=2952224 RepID=A0ABT1UDR7_9GAMM|nr:NAD(P)-dependent oxidoreductase [Methylomonas sp. SURF-1]MCQ8180377.1 NAD(P)-dependent oxidoreductase [Methylomonas sp. SURF-1]
MLEQRYKLGFVGIGLMGRPLVLRLLQAGYAVRVWNRDPEKTHPVAEAGAEVCGSVAELVRATDVTILCLADTAAVEQVVVQQVLNYGGSGKLLIDLSSIDPETTRRLARELKAACGMAWVDAPVSGGTAGAEQGTLAIMAGGDAADIAVAREVLRPLYSRLTHMGLVGSGQTTKICNQMIVSCNVLAIAEMMALAKAAGVDAAKIPEALAGGFADSKPLQIVGPEMAAECFEPVKWRVKTLLKDLNMAVELAAKQGSAVPMSGLAAQLMQLHGSRGFLEQDPATLVKQYLQS